MVMYLARCAAAPQAQHGVVTKLAIVVLTTSLVGSVVGIARGLLQPLLPFLAAPVGDNFNLPTSHVDQQHDTILPPPRVFLTDLELLLEHRDHLSEQWTALLARANSTLLLKPMTVMDKNFVAESGDKHDYFSIGPYWWPNASSPDGLPYVRRDGQVNPASRQQTDSQRFLDVSRAIEVLGTAYYATRVEAYAEKAVELARAWFLDPNTAMNPNLQYAQAVPGIVAGRNFGIIEGANLIWANEGLAMLQVAGSTAWTEHDQRAMHSWNSHFFVWLTKGSRANREKATKNNHGTWYDAQAAHLAMTLGRDVYARNLLDEARHVRLERQIEPDGRQPHELARSRPFSYSIYNLQGLMMCAMIAEHVSMDWWGHVTADGRSLRAALRLLAPFLDPNRAWATPEVGPPTQRERMVPLFYQFLKRAKDDVLQTALSLTPLQAPEPWRLVMPDKTG